MSTKAIREAIEQCKKMAHHLDHDGNWNLALEAKAEVEAIEKAAKVFAEYVEGRFPKREQLSAATHTMERIAKDAK